MATRNTPKNLPYATKGDLTNGPIQNHLIRLTVPMIWGLFAVISVQLADTFFISLLGDKELTAISFTFPVTMILTHLVFGFNIALSSVVSRLIGAQDWTTIKRVVLHSLIIAFMTSLTLATIVAFNLQFIFDLLGTDESSFKIIQPYMLIWLCGFAVFSLPVNANSAVRAAGDSFRPALIMLVCSFVNFCLDPILMFGWFGFPAMGVTGVAYATVTAYSLAVILAFILLISRANLIALDGLYLKDLGNTARRLLVIALPAGITNIILPATSAVIVALLAAYDPQAVAGYGVASRIEAFAMLVVMALSVGMAPVIGQNWGAELFARVHETIKLAIKFNFVWSFSIAAILAIFARPIASIFSDSATIQDYVIIYFYIVPISYGFGNLVYGWSSAFNAMGKPQRSFAMITIKSLVLLLPAIFLASTIGGAKEIFLAIALINFISGIAFHIYSEYACRSDEISCLEKEGKTITATT